MNPSSHRFDPNRMTHSHGDLRFHGSVVVQLKPEKIRVVLAVVSEAETAEDCHALNVAAVKKVRDVWRTMGIEDDNVVEDFIAMLPRYEWFYERRMAKLTDSEEWIKEMMKMDADQREDFDPDLFVNPDFFKLAIMKKTGHRIQSNIHLETDTESNAMEAINAAFEKWGQRHHRVRLLELKNGPSEKGSNEQSSAGSENQSRYVAVCLRCLLYTSPSPRDRTRSRMPSSA